MTGGEIYPEPGEALQNKDEALYRNVRVKFVQDGHVSSQVFEPSPDDGQLLSTDRSSLTQARDAFELFMKRPFCESSGVLSVLVNECINLDVPPLSNPLKDNAAHAVLDFRAHNGNQTKKRAGKLRDMALRRGWSHKKS